MKRSFLFLLLFIGMNRFSSAAEPVFLFPEGEAPALMNLIVGVSEGKRIVVPRQYGLILSSTCSVVFANGVVFEAYLETTTNRDNMLCFRLGSSVANDDVIMGAMRTVLDFNSLLKNGAVGGDAQAEFGVSQTLSQKKPLLFSINDQTGEERPVVLSAEGTKASCVLKVGNASGGSLTKFSLQIESNPALSFWRVTNERSQKDVPRPLFAYDFQALFNKFKDGESVLIPVEIFFVKTETALWTVRFKTKTSAWAIKIPVRFEKIKK